MSKILCLTEPFHFLGQVDFRVISGSVSVNGHSFTASQDTFYRIFSPRTSALMLVEPKSESVLEFKSVQNGLEGLQTCQSTFNNMLQPNSEEALANAFEEVVPGFFILKATCDAFQEIPLMKIPSDWLRVLEDVKRKDPTSCAPVIFVCGHRKVGKSSFSRYLLNGLLNEYEAVEFVDLDPGQTEFTPSGFLARKRLENPLMGPPFTHLTVPDDAIYLGTSNGSEVPFIYCRAMQTIQSNLNKTSVPVIINTMGWMTGLGLELITRALQVFKPSHVISFMAPENNEDIIRKCLTSPSFGINEPVFTSEEAENIYVRYMDNPVGEGPRGKHSPADQRNLAYWAYFFGNMPDDSVTGRIDKFNFSTELSALRPVVVPLANLQLACTSREIDLFDLVRSRAETERFELLESWLLMRLVGISKDDKFIAKHSINLLPNSKVSRIADMKSFGIGLVRSIARISESRVHLHLLTPLPLSVLSECNTLILGSLQLPLPMLSADSLSLQSEAPGFSTQIVGTDVNGAGARKTRHNMRRK